MQVLEDMSGMAEIFHSMFALQERASLDYIPETVLFDVV